MLWLLLFLFAFSSLAQPLLLEGTFPAGEGPNDFVRDIEMQPDGRILVGGNFETFNGVPTGPLVRLLPDGSLDPNFNSRFLGSGSPSISRIRLASDGRIVVQGNFTNVSGVPVKDLALLMPDGLVDTSFSIPATLPFSPFTSSIGTILPAPDGGFWVSGSFTNIGGIQTPRIAKLRADGSVDASFHAPFPVLPEAGRNVLPLPDGRIIIAGGFTNVSGVPVPHIARLLPNGDLDPTFSSDLPASISLTRLVRMPDGALVGTSSSGNLTTVLNEPATLIRLHANGAVDKTFNPQFVYPGTLTSIYNRVLALLPEPDGSLIVTGTFRTVDGRERYGLARLLPDGTVSACFDPGIGPSSFVIAMARQQDGRILIGGVFRSVEGQNRAYLARLESQADCGPGEIGFASPEFQVLETAPSALVTIVRNGSVARAESVRIETTTRGDFDLQFEPGDRAKSFAIALRTETNSLHGGETVGLKLASGSGQIVPPMTASLRIIADTNLLGAGAVDTAFHPVLEGPVMAAAFLPSGGEGGFLVGYSITNGYGSADYAHYSMRRLDAQGRADETFIQTNLFDGEVHAFASLPDGHFLVAGFFNHVNGHLRPGLARFDRSGRLDTTFNPFPNFALANTSHFPSVTDLYVESDGSIICAGHLPEDTQSYDGFRLFRVSADGALDVQFIAAQERQAAGAPSLARLPDGSFAIAVSETAGVARFFPSGERDSRFIPPPFYPAGVTSLAALADGSLIAGGMPLLFSSEVSPNLVRLAPNGGRIAQFEMKVSHSIDQFRSSISRVLADLDGRILVAGQIQIGATNIITILRFHADGTWDPTFDAGTGADPRTVAYAGSSGEIEPRVDVLKPFPGGGWLVGGDFAGFDGVAQPFLLRLLPRSERIERIRLTSDRWEINESAEVLWVNVARTGSLTNTAIVHLRTIGESALPGTDYIPVEKKLNFLPGESLKQVQILIQGNDLAESNRTFRVVLSGEGSTAGLTNIGTVTILDDDVNVEFVSEAITASENDHVVRIGLRRTGIPGDTLSVEVAGGSAVRSITFPATQQRSVVNYLELPIVDDDEYAPDQAFSLQLRITGGDATPGSLSHATLRIIDNDYPESPGRGVSGTINVMAEAPNGGVYIGGDFSSIHGTQRPNIARLLANGEVDPAFDPGFGPDAAVTAVAVQADGRVLIGGDFYSVNGQLRRQLARLLPSGAVDETFDVGVGPSSETSYPSRINAFSLDDDGSIFVGGQFTSFNGYAQGSLVRLHPDGTLDSSFISPLTSSLVFYGLPFYSGSSEASTVREIHKRPGGIALVGQLYVRAKTRSLSYTQTQTAVGLSTNGEVDNAFLAQPLEASISTLCPLTSGGWLAGGSFGFQNFGISLPPGTNWIRITRLQQDGAVDPSFTVRDRPPRPVFSSVVRQISLDPQGRILFLAELGTRNPNPLRSTVLGRLYADGSWDHTFPLLEATNTVAPPPFFRFPDSLPSSYSSDTNTASIRTMSLQPDGTLVLGGSFNEMNGEPRRRLARIDLTGQLRGILALSISSTDSGLVQLITGPEVEAPYIIEESTDLLNWRPVRTNSTPWFPLSLSGEASALESPQFFRAVSVE